MFIVNQLGFAFIWLNLQTTSQLVFLLLFPFLAGFPTPRNSKNIQDILRCFFLIPVGFFLMEIKPVLDFWSIGCPSSAAAHPNLDHMGMFSP